MTAHELARKLLEGPDVPVVYHDHVGYESETEIVQVDFTESVEVWQTKYCRSDDWSEFLERKPRNETLPVRSVQAVRLA